MVFGEVFHFSFLGRLVETLSFVVVVLRLFSREVVLG
jgi:hypothetical protein